MTALAGGRAKGGTLVFRLARQPGALPARVSRRFRVTDIYRPRFRQRQAIEHPAPVPAVVLPLPEQRMLNSVIVNPAPVVRRPELRPLIAAGFDELEKAGVRDVE